MYWLIIVIQDEFEVNFERVYIKTMIRISVENHKTSTMFKKIFSKWGCFWFITFNLMLGLSVKLCAQEIQAFPELKEFSKLPQLPKIELLSNIESIKTLQPVNTEFNGLRIPTIQLNDFEKSELVGEWKADHPFVANFFSGKTTIEGIIFTILPDSSFKKEWTSEGVFFESTTKEGARRFASSFDYKIIKNVILLRITSSSNELNSGITIPFEILGITKNSENKRVLRLKNDKNIIDLIEVERTGRFTFTTEDKSDFKK